MSPASMSNGSPLTMSVIKKSSVELARVSLLPAKKPADRPASFDNIPLVSLLNVPTKSVTLALSGLLLTAPTSDHLNGLITRWSTALAPNSIV